MSLHIRRERIQCFVEVVDLYEDAHDHDNCEDIRARMRELITSAQCELERDAKSLDGHDGHGANKRAYGDVYERVRITVLRCDGVDHDEREDEDR